MSESPSQAVLCEYGKAVKAGRAFQTMIGPIPFLAPEVRDPNGYTNKIDIWGVGIVCCSMLFSKAISDLSTKGQQPDATWWRMMSDMLAKYEGKGDQEKSFSHLIKGMFCWRHQERYTVDIFLIWSTHSPFENLTYIMSF